MMRIFIEYIGGGQYVVTNGRDSLNLTPDMGIVPVAETFGMRARHKRPRFEDGSLTGVECSKAFTDGTVACPECGQTAGAFYAQAMAYIERRADDGRTVADPGYFDE